MEVKVDHSYNNKQKTKARLRLSMDYLRFIYGLSTDYLLWIMDYLWIIYGLLLLWPVVIIVKFLSYKNLITYWVNIVGSFWEVATVRI